MNSEDVREIRLRNQLLAGSELGDPVEVVRWLGAVQAQDYGMAKWGVGLRLKGGNEVEIEKALDAGRILRTHVMRPTWHLVAAEDLGWMQSLTAPNVFKMNAYMCRKVELDEEILGRCVKLFEKVLADGNCLTRTELGGVLEEQGIVAKGQRLAYIVMFAELTAVICSGPRKGKQFSYGLVNERVKKARRLEGDEALMELARRYFGSHGPAQVRDFGWWSGLKMGESRRAVELLRKELVSEKVEGKEYWWVEMSEAMAKMEERAYLLSIFDEYTIGYTDRSDLGADQKSVEEMLRMGNALTAVLVLEGKVVGTWRKEVRGKKVEIQVKPFGELGKREWGLVEEEGRRYGEFWGVEVGMRE